MSYPKRMVHPVTGVQFAFSKLDEDNMLARGWVLPPSEPQFAVAKAEEDGGAFLVKRKPGRPRKQ